jgi:hypothetical protein
VWTWLYAFVHPTNKKEKVLLWEQLNSYQEFEDLKIIPLNWTANELNLRVDEIQSETR